MNKDNKIITRESKLGQIVEDYPAAANLLLEKYNLHCVGCFAAIYETLEEGAKAHGMDDEQIDKMIGDLNKIIQKKNRK